MLKVQHYKMYKSTYKSTQIQNETKSNVLSLKKSL